MATTEYEALATTIGSEEVVLHWRKGNAKAGEQRDDTANRSETGRLDFILKAEGNTQSVEREREREMNSIWKQTLQCFDLTCWTICRMSYKEEKETRLTILGAPGFIVGVSSRY